MQPHEQLQIRSHGDAALPTLIYLPGLHGDWTLIPSFRAAVAGHARFVEFTYPRTTEWSLEDYAAALEGALVANGITSGWLLAESFGSQPAWAVVKRAKANRPSARGPLTSILPPGGGEETFTPTGLILAGGFVRHPAHWAVRLTRRIGGRMPLRWITRLLFGYAKFARFRHRRAPETLAHIEEFIARRTEADRAAAVHRLGLILANDLRPIAASATVPVFALTGFWDPVVPWPWTFRWLRRHCPALRATRIIGRADHNVLSTAPRESAQQVLAWIGQGAGRRAGAAAARARPADV
jgi:pimeloyl-ACP methyl ester carboxylesterase